MLVDLTIRVSIKNRYLQDYNCLTYNNIMFTTTTSTMIDPIKSIHHQKLTWHCKNKHSQMYLPVFFSSQVMLVFGGVSIYALGISPGDRPDDHHQKSRNSGQVSAFCMAICSWFCMAQRFCSAWKWWFFLNKTKETRNKQHHQQQHPNELSSWSSSSSSFWENPTSPPISSQHISQWKICIIIPFSQGIWLPENPLPRRPRPFFLAPKSSHGILYTFQCFKPGTSYGSICLFSEKYARQIGSFHEDRGWK